VAGLLIGAGCRMPWISAMGFFGLTPPLTEIWPIAVGAALVGVLGLTALAYTEQMSRVGWLLSFILVVGIGALTYPHYREIAEEIGASDPGFGVSQGLGLWLIAAGMIAGLIGSAGGWRASKPASTR
jgi:hypothetical protein